MTDTDQQSPTFSHRVEVIDGMTNEAYHADASFSSSFLKKFERSARHAKVPFASTKSMTLGTAIHTALLEPERFAETYVCPPEGIDRRTTEGKAFFKKHEAAGSCILSSVDHATLKRVVKSVSSHPHSRVILDRPSYSELSIFWSDAEHSSESFDCRLRVRPDIAIEPCEDFPNGLLIDVKSTKDATEEAFAKDIVRLGYHLSAAMYAEGFQIAFGTDELPEYWILACEKDAICECMYFDMKDFMAMGYRMYRRCLAKAVECEKRQEWPGYPTSLVRIQPPAWAVRQEEAHEAGDALVDVASDDDGDLEEVEDA